MAPTNPINQFMTDKIFDFLPDMAIKQYQSYLK
jgi:hypothetical protein